MGEDLTIEVHHKRDFLGNSRLLYILIVAIVTWIHICAKFKKQTKQNKTQNRTERVNLVWYILKQNKRHKKVTKGALQKHAFYLKVFAAKLSVLTYSMSPVLHKLILHCFDGIKYLYQIKFILFLNTIHSQTW